MNVTEPLAMSIAASLLLSACVEDPAIASDPVGSAAGFTQSETSMARAFDPTTDSTRILLAYNDMTDMYDGMVTEENYSLLGLSVSDDLGATWQRVGQLPAGGDSEVLATRGDPWIDAVGSLVLYAGLGGEPAIGGVFPPGTGVKGVVITRSTDGGGSFEPLTEIVDGFVDGPKVSIARDESRALVVWTSVDSGIRLTSYLVIENPRTATLTPAGVGPPLLLDDEFGHRPPGEEGYVPACAPDGYQLADAQPHPIGFIGPSGAFYIARVARWRDVLGECMGVTDHLEVFRSTNYGGDWERIYYLPNVYPPFDMLGDTHDAINMTRPAIVAVADADGVGDQLVLALARSLGQETQRVWVHRLEDANDCLTTSKMADGGCGGWTTHYPADSVAFVVDEQEYQAYKSPYHYAYAPALFAGGSGADDDRVGLFFYAQPHRGDPGATETQRRFTAVVGLYSEDGTATWSLGRGLNRDFVGHEAIYTDTHDGRSGPVFIPCPDHNEYFGHYNGGAFQFDDPSQNEAVAAWAESREGCVDQRPWLVDQQQVFTARYPPYVP